MKKYRFFVIIALFVLFSSVSFAQENQTKIFTFKAKTWNGSANSSNSLNGDYEVTRSGGKCEVTQAGSFVAGNSMTELCRMVGVDLEGRRYTSPPPEVGQLNEGKKWSQSYSYNPPGGRRMLNKTVDYLVVSSKKNQDGSVKLFNIEGNATITDRSGRMHTQKWIYSYNPNIDVIVEFLYDSSVDGEGAKIKIDLVSQN